jgi:hypothetical protein
LENDPGYLFPFREPTSGRGVTSGEVPMRLSVALLAVVALAGPAPAQWSAPQPPPAPAEEVAPGIRETPKSPPSGPGRKGATQPEPKPRGRARPEDRSPDVPGGDLRARRQQQAWRDSHPGDVYRYLEDPVHRLVYATCLDETSHADMALTLARQADQQAATLFDAMPEVEVFIAVATPADIRRTFDNDPRTAGMYEHRLRRIVTGDIGTVLRHEFTHAMHFGHMERTGQPHAMWVQEGLAALYERYELSESGEITFLPTARHNDVRRLVAQRKGPVIEPMMAMTPSQFMAVSDDLYPVSRSFFEYLADQGKLRRWYRAYVDGFDADRTGRAAAESALGKPVAEVERDWRAWVKARPAVDVTVGKGDRPVGVTVADATDGARVTAVARGSAASRAGLRVGDVIVSVAGTEVRSSREWTEASASLRVPEAPIVVRRGTDRIEFTLRWEGQASAAGRPRALARRLPAGTDRPGFRAGSLDRAATATETRASCT